ncbi:MAG TPA: tetratricopeptide repeat protein, partial [Phaeodactylibacter sp.]|nr:tetratricopeptide repeat protein [Phaeodactylibacter sp.]
SGSTKPKALTFRKELIRTKDVLAALLGLEYEDSLWSHLSAKGRYENTIRSILNLILSISTIQPLIIEIEDGHWLDSSSNAILRELIKEMHAHPYVVFVTSRFADDGTANTLIDSTYLKSLNVKEKIILLPSLPAKDIKAFAEKMLGGKINKAFYELLLRTSNSNPFYLEQILKYFMESRMIHKEKDKWAIRDKSIQLSTSINAILTARIDRLSNLVKETVKAAAVIGLEFEVPVLSAVMEEQHTFIAQKENYSGLLKDQIKKAEQVQIWRAMNELRYIFRHALLREAVYGMQLHTRLKKLHRLIAEAIERLYPKTIAQRYTDLAFHYENGGVKDKTILYLKKAADYARQNFQNRTALKHYDKLLEKLEEEGERDKIVKILIRKGQVLRLIGKWEKSKETFQLALIEAEAIGDKLLTARAYNNLGNLQTLKGNYQDAHIALKRALDLFEELKDQKGILKAFGYLGELNFRQGKYHKAEAFFENSLQINESLPTPLNLSNIVSNLALTYMNRGEFDKGIAVQEKQMEMAQAWNDKKGLATLYTNTGIVLLEKGSYNEALERFEQGLKLTEELGDRFLNSICIGCMGSVYQRQGKYEQAMKCFQRDLEICEELGDKQGIA